MSRSDPSRAGSSLDPFGNVVSMRIDHEMSLIQEAIALVRVGCASRVVVASLHFGDELMPRARALAGLSGLKVTPLWTLDEQHHSVAIEPRGD